MLTTFLDLIHGPLKPELMLVLSAVLLLMYGVFHHDERGVSVGWLAILALLVVGFLIAFRAYNHPGAYDSAFEGAWINDAFARYMKMLVLIGAIGGLLLSFAYFRDVKAMRFEYPILVLLSCAGMFMMISAGDLISLYLGLEMQSLALYVCAAIRRDDVRSSEAGLKYFVLGALSSGMLLYGASLLYGFTGSTHFADIAFAAHAITPATPNVGLLFGLVFLLAGLAFKVSAVPFHMWAPDVYQGAPTPVTAFFAAAPKVAAFALLIRVLVSAFPAITSQWQLIITFMAVASMFLGAVAAIGQNNIKRLMAYSSIANGGFALVGLAAGTQDGVQGVLIYLAIYVAMTLGAFACILAMRRKGHYIEDIHQLAGLGKTNLPLAALLAALMFSLAGIPPLAGFWAKWFVFLPAVRAGMWGLAVVGVLTSVIGAYYYLRIIKIMFFDEAAEKFEPMPGVVRFVLGVAAAFVILFSLYPAPLVEAATRAAHSLF
jgi:NADH-quinone oxidoreductase subunit N